MNNQLNAIEMETPDGWVPLAYARSNRLRAVLWESDAGCHFTILGVNPETGVPDNSFRPQDAEDLARLTVVMSYAMHLGGDVGRELADDLGCLAYCLNQTLGIDLNSLVPHPDTVQ